MTNHLITLAEEVIKFNKKHNADIRFLKVLNEEVTFAELETSISHELLFEFGVQFGFMETKKHIENNCN